MNITLFRTTVSGLLCLLLSFCAYPFFSAAESAPAPAYPDDTLRYDCNLDGILNIADVTGLLWAVAGGVSPAVGVGDTNKDGLQSIADVSEELNFLADYDAPTLTPRDKTKQYNVLMIGNSFSYYNDLNRSNGIFYKVAHAAGYDLSVTCVYCGAYYLRQFLDPTDKYGSQVLGLLQSDTKYDIVIIQEQSANPIAKPQEFYDGCRRFKELVDANGGELWLYDTWGYEGSGKATDRFDMEMKLRAAYTAAAEKLGIGVAYAGAAMTSVNQHFPDFAIYDTDNKHPSLIGSTLAAYTLAGTIFGFDPLESSINNGIAADTAASLKLAASHIVRHGAPVADGYEMVFTDPVVRDTEILTSLPTSSMVSIVSRDSATVGDGWMRYKNDASRTFSGIRGDKDKIASTEYSASALTDEQKADIADIGYGVSIVGIQYMDGTKSGTKNTTDAGVSTSVGNLVNGHWGQSYMAAMFFDADCYTVDGEKSADAPYTALITLNFGERKQFDAIGYLSGNLDGFAQAQDVYVSDDGEHWTLVPTACFDASDTPLSNIGVRNLLDPWNGNYASVGTFFGMNGAAGKYIRIGIIRGGNLTNNNTGLEGINTREILVYGSEIGE